MNKLMLHTHDENGKRHARYFISICRDGQWFDLLVDNFSFDKDTGELNWWGDESDSKTMTLVFANYSECYIREIAKSINFDF